MILNIKFMKKSQLKLQNKDKNFHKYRRIKSLIFLVASLSTGVLPHVCVNKYSKPIILVFTFLYGATSGNLFAAGQAGERFAVRNSGATTVFEVCD